MNTIKLVHLHSDLKFVRSTVSFEGAPFENQIIIIGKKKEYEGQFHERVQWYDENKEDIEKVIGLCRAADGVVVFGLDHLKSYIVNRIPKEIKVIWRFFGFELYGKFPELIYSEQTLKYKGKKNAQGGVAASLKKAVRKIESLFKWQGAYDTEFNRALNRIDYFQGLALMEYDFLKKHVPALPPFIQNPYLNNVVKETAFVKSNEVILGNSRHAFNNHLDVFDILTQTTGRAQYTFKLFFSYGPNDHYTEAVRSAAGAIKEVTILQDFIPFQEFCAIYAGACALVMNGQRQMAMGNITTAIKNNVKVYLNSKNVIYDTLISEGFHIYNMDDLAADLEHGRLALSEGEAKHNIDTYNSLSEKYSQADFHSRLMEIFNRN